VFQIVILVVALILKAFFSGAETALIASDRMQISHLSREGDLRATTVERLLAKPERLLGVTLLGTNLSMVIATVMATVIAIRIGDWAETLVTAAMVVIVLIATEMIPKGYAARYSIPFALKSARPLLVASYILGPLARPFNALPRMLISVFKRPAYQASVDDDAIMTMVEIGEEEGVVAESEKEMIEAVLDSGELTVNAIMTPRVEIVALNSQSDWQDVTTAVLESGYSRLPVYEGTIDNIVGIIHSKDVLTALTTEDHPLVTELLHATIFVPEGKVVGELLRELRDQKLHMAVVLDEFGGTAGLITIEDLLEEIVGEIQDEYDDDEEPEFVRTRHGAVLDARLSLDTVNEELELELPTHQYDTIGGFAFGLFGYIPNEGEVVEDEQHGVRLIVEEIEGRRITKLRMEKKTG
ncbi:MAG: hemolysin family protein, partial [Bacillota bacterium]